MAKWDRDHENPTDWNEAQDGWHYCLICLPNSVGWRVTLESAIWEMTSARFYAWENGAALESKRIATEVFASMSFDCNNNLERIAEALERIATAEETKVTLDELLEDIENTLGVTHAFYKTLKWVADLIPNVSAKIDMTPLVWGFWDWWRWKLPVLTNLTSMSASLVTIAAAMVAEAPLSLLRTVLSAFDSALNLNNRIYEFLVGDWNWYDDVFKPLWDFFVSDGEGGTGGDDPDTDPDKRIIVKTFVEGDIMTVTQTNMQTVNCGGSSGCGGGGEYVPGGESPCQSDYDMGDMEIDPEGEGGAFPAGFESWEDYSVFKCKAANVMTLSFAETLYQLGAMSTIDAQKSSHALTADAIKKALIVTAKSTDRVMFGEWAYDGPGYSQLLDMINGWLAEKIADQYYPVDNRPDPFDIFYALRLDWLDDMAARVCELFAAENTTEVRGAILSAASDYIDTYSQSQTYKDWALSVISGLLTGVWCNILFTPNESVAAYSDESAINCVSQCAGYYVVWGIDHGDGLVEAQDQGNQYAVEIIVNGSVFEPGPRSEVGWTIVSGSVTTTDDKGYRLYGETDEDINLFYEDNDPPTNPQCLRAITLTHDDGMGGATFTIQFAIGDICT